MTFIKGRRHTSLAHDYSGTDRPLNEVRLTHQVTEKVRPRHFSTERVTPQHGVDRVISLGRLHSDRLHTSLVHQMQGLQLRRGVVLARVR